MPTKTHAASLIVALAKALCGLAIAADGYDDTRPYGRIAWAVDRDGEELLLTSGTMVKPGEAIVGHADAKFPCELFVVPLTMRERHLPAGWLPIATELHGNFNATSLPLDPARWVWPASAAAIELHVVFAKPGDPATQPLKSFIAEIAAAKTIAPGAVKEQSLRLRELLLKIAPAPASTSPPKKEAVQGAPLRGGRNPWQPHAAGINLDRGPGLLVFEIGLPAAPSR